ncbi:hypothetical protein NECAME_16170 [Necator americanus]|uniref:Uncharacterized protein n=1 Tax=Necator americanus TaxID=51031 RepID=W2U0A1_NECAM|nr:hypothetical protein NECAME_16170 [Necator americanus]ETN86727.1 hypothetical protein NECAME_16170 [Necator americanus]
MAEQPQMRFCSDQSLLARIASSMRCLVLFAVCVWIACADIGCNWSSSLTRSAKPEDGILTWIKAFGEDGKMYTYAVTGGDSRTVYFQEFKNEHIEKI